MLRLENDIVSEINCIENTLKRIAAKLEAIHRLGSEEYITEDLVGDETFCDIPRGYIVESSLTSIRNAATELGFNWRKWNDEDVILSYMNWFRELKRTQDRIDYQKTECE